MLTKLPWEWQQGWQNSQDTSGYYVLFFLQTLQHTCPTMLAFQVSATFPPCTAHLEAGQNSVDYHVAFLENQYLLNPGMYKITHHEVNGFMMICSMPNSSIFRTVCSLYRPKFNHFAGFWLRVIVTDPLLVMQSFMVNDLQRLSLIHFSCKPKSIDTWLLLRWFGFTNYQFTFACRKMLLFFLGLKNHQISVDIFQLANQQQQPVPIFRTSERRDFVWSSDWPNSGRWSSRITARYSKV